MALGEIERPATRPQALVTIDEPFHHMVQSPVRNVGDYVPQLTISAQQGLHMCIRTSTVFC